MATTWSNRVPVAMATTLEEDEVLNCVMQSLAVAPLLDIASDMDIQVPHD